MVDTKKNKHQIVKVSPTAHAKMILHAVRHPRSSIHGILIGRFLSEGPVLIIEDALPVCHSPPTKPILDIALRLAEAYTESSFNESGTSSGSDLGIVGWYTANERLGDDAPAQAALKVVGSIGAVLAASSNDHEHSEPVLIVVTSLGLATLFGSTEEIEISTTESDNKHCLNALQIYERDSKKHWLREIPMDSISSSKSDWSSSTDFLLEICREDSKTLPFFDFEDHLEGGVELIGERDWIRNTKVAKYVQDRV